MSDISDNSEVDYENILHQRDIYKDIIDDTLSLVNAFIKSNERILVGGMAIDMALRSVGDKLYGDNKFPDYDFISVEFFKDAYDLGNMIAEKYSNISIINAFHASTMRVRVEFQEAADITYVPKNIHDKIPFLKYNNFKIVHPHYQFIDQHRALSTPFENPPNETFTSRWKKDIQRYSLLYKHFPIKSVKPKQKIDLIIHELNYNKLSEVCICGYAAVAFWIQSATLDGYKPPSDKNLSDCFNLGWKKSDGKITCMVPKLSMLSDDFEEVIKELPGKSVDYYNAVLDKINRKIIVSDNKKRYEIIDNKGSMRSAHKIDDKLFVSNIQGIMCYLLTNNLLLDDEHAQNTYVLLVDILEWAANKYQSDADDIDKTGGADKTDTDNETDEIIETDSNGKIIKSVEHEKVQKVQKNTNPSKYLKYLPSLEVFGKYNVYNSITLNMTRIDAFLEKRIIDRATPKNAYLDKGDVVPTNYYNFETKNNPIYAIDGLKTEPFKSNIL